ncbi:MAG TPA: hypothetical protein VM534_07250, partial [Thermoanaerobaculia bacterium]|nr:hypothetical protein [Thermoanaerobaculia bacterium]
MSRLIAIDCRKIEDFGIGTHLAGLLSGLLDAAGPERFVLLIKRGQQDLAPVDPRFTAAVCDAPGYSLRELWEVARAARQAGANLLHLPHYVTPFSSLPLVVTVHDLIHLQLGRRELPAGA